MSRTVGIAIFTEMILSSIQGIESSGEKYFRKYITQSTMSTNI